MRAEDLASPGIIPNGYALKKEALKSINFISQVSEFTGSTSHAAGLVEFYLACAEAVKPFVEPTPKNGK